MERNKKATARAGMRRAKEIARFARDIAVSAAQEALNSATAGERRPMPPQAALQTTGKDAPLATPPDEPPVVARLMVEIRSDGSRTIARGALQDELSGEKVAIEAKGNSPLELAAQLAKSLLTTPLNAATLGRALMASRRKP